jgi:hypothetical protein
MNKIIYNHFSISLRKIEKRRVKRALMISPPQLIRLDIEVYAKQFGENYDNNKVSNLIELK